MDIAPDIELTDAERVLIAAIDADSPEYETRIASFARVRQVMELLVERGAIPEARQRYFLDPECNPSGRGKSRRERFEGNSGTRGSETYDHPHFVKYLHYFVCGPELPDDIKVLLREQAATWGHLRMSEAHDIFPHIRAAVRRHRLEPHEAAEEIYKLALECGAMPSTAASLRSTVVQMKVR